MLEVEIFNPEDSVGVRDLIYKILKEEYPFDMSAYSDTDVNDISGVYGGDRNAFFVIRDKNKVVGAVGVKGETDDLALLRRLFVDSDYRKKGLGTRLLEKAIYFCKEKNYKKIEFRATDRMKNAINLLEKNGFKKDETLELAGFHIHKYSIKL